jgi:hypothetical protein
MLDGSGPGRVHRLSIKSFKLEANGTILENYMTLYPIGASFINTVVCVSVRVMDLWETLCESYLCMHHFLVVDQVILLLGTEVRNKQLLCHSPNSFRLVCPVQSMKCGCER